MKFKNFPFPIVLICLFFLSGCASVSKGITQAVLEKNEKEQKYCEITGGVYFGVKHSLDSQSETNGKVTKILMVHGVSQHVPGYSVEFRDNLINYLGLDSTSKHYKEISIRNPEFVGEDGEMIPLGVLRVTRHLDDETGSELLFYELTWSEISREEKKTLEFDKSRGFRRAVINKITKNFFNETVSDLMVYRGKSREAITKSVGQAVCWEFSGGWDDLPKDGEQFCDATKLDLAPTIKKDDYFFVTHSLGSMVTVDAISNVTELSDSPKARKSSKLSEVSDALKDKEITVFMMSNQLPLLRIGLEDPEITGKRQEYCKVGAPKYNKRSFKSLNLVAFSDPNDILSYEIPAHYSEKYLDSRLCAQVWNVDINVAEVKKLFGVGFASPAEAHLGYQSSKRVAEIIANGVGPKSTDFPKGCRWIKTVD